MQAEMEMIMRFGLLFSNTATTIGIRIPKVPQDVPVANARKQQPYIRSYNLCKIINLFTILDFY